MVIWVSGLPMRMSQVKARSQAPPQTLPPIMAMTGVGWYWTVRSIRTRPSS